MVSKLAVGQHSVLAYGQYSCASVGMRWTSGWKMGLQADKAVDL